MKNTILFCICNLLITGSLSAAGPSVIDSTAYTRWKRVDGEALSNNGQWVKYNYAYINNEEMNKECNDRFYFWNRQNGKTITLDSISNVMFFGGGNWISYTNRRKAYEDKTFFMDLRSKKKMPWKRNGSPRCESNLPLVSYKNKDKATVFLHLVSKDSIVYQKIGPYELLDKGRKILYIKKTDDAYSLCYGDLYKPTSHQVIFRDEERLLSRFDYSHGKGKFEISHKENQTEYNRYYTFNLSDKKATLLTDTKEWKISADIYKKIRNFRCLGNGSLWELQMGEPSYKRKRKDQKEAKRDSSFSLQLWSWNDRIIQSEQAKSGFEEERREADKYIYDVNSGHVQKVLDGKFTTHQYQPGNHPKFMLVVDNTAFKGTENWQHMERKDLALVELATGKMDYFSKQQIQRPFWSRNGDYVIFYDDYTKEWKRLEPQSKKIESITAAIPHPIYNEMYDLPHAEPPYGLAAWNEDGTKAYIYDAFDIWEVNMNDLQHPVCYTKGFGRRDQMIIRFMSINYEDNLTIPAKGITRLHLTDWKTRNMGIGHMTASSKLQKDFYGDFMFQIPAADASRRYLLLNRQSFEEGRDTWVLDINNGKCKKVTDANPNHNGYAWGSVKMVQWTNFAGKTNQGLLYLPAGYEEGKEYPMIVNYYESHASEMHVYYMPDWCSAMLDVPTYLSRGYIIFKPDVYFKTGYPVQSTYDAVVSGVEYLVKEGIATPGRIGVQGHSWSGCTVANLITMTDIFSCASVGAGVVNMTESYTALRHGTGNTRMFMYEDWQSRIGKSLWEDPEAYLRNSAIFRANKIKTPVLIMHNDKDEAVEYHEGRNFYMAMRRLQKPAWLLNYEGEGHFILNPAAQRDWTRRMLQFFDYYLKGTDIPRWMKEGINVNEKGLDWKMGLVKE